MRERNIKTEEGELERAREFEKAENLKARVTAINDVEAKKQLLRMKIKSPMNCRISQRFTMKRKLFFLLQKKGREKPNGKDFIQHVSRFFFFIVIFSFHG